MSETRTCETCGHPMSVAIVRERTIRWRESGAATLAVVRLRRCCECYETVGTIEVPLTEIADVAGFDPWQVLMEMRY